MAIKGVGDLYKPSKQAFFNKIVNLWDTKKYALLSKEITLCTDKTMASEIAKVVFSKVVPICWLSFLRNHNLNTILDRRELHNIFTTVVKLLKAEKVTQEVAKKLHKILLIIAKNSAWCRMLSYAFFVDYLQLSGPLAEHVIFDEDFITHLDYFHVAKLIKLVPEHLSVLLEYFESMLENHPKQLWALTVLKEIFIQHTFVQRLILTDPSYEDSLAKLKDEFATDCNFATQVLKNLDLCDEWLHIDNKHAYEHHLFKRSDYLGLADHFFKRNITLALEYSIFAMIVGNEPKIEDRFLSSKVAFPITEPQPSTVLLLSAKQPKNPTKHTATLLLLDTNNENRSDQHLVQKDDTSDLKRKSSF